MLERADRIVWNMLERPKAGPKCEGEGWGPGIDECQGKHGYRVWPGRGSLSEAMNPADERFSRALSCRLGTDDARRTGSCGRKLCFRC